MFLLMLAGWAGMPTRAAAGGPRFVTGTTFTAAPAGTPIAFYTANPLYYTDPGDLAEGVSHAQADTMVAAAAGIWNTPTALLTIAQGGALAEHVSSSNAFFDGNEVVFPADVAASNYRSKPIAVIYDTDGSVTDLLLGSGASDPSECRTDGVTESVDSLGPGATINHAVLVLNGRCVGSAPEQLLQMQYQLERAFGRVLGLSWSQCNDNMFTGLPSPNVDEMANWPIMHPIDILCGPYPYQCMQNAFTLRPDDVSALAMLYPVTSSNVTPGKEVSTTGGTSIVGWVNFPSGQGMELVNVIVRRLRSGHGETDDWEEASGVTGLQYQQNGGSPVSGPEPAGENVGSTQSVWEGLFQVGRVPFESKTANLYLTTEPINPLYTGEYAIGPYQRQPESLSVSPVTAVGYSEVPGYSSLYTLTMKDGATSCSPGNDGTERSPAAVDPSGWWTGLLCGLGHASWGNASIKANRTWTMEVTAEDEAGRATLYKAQPVMGLWQSTDPTGTLPTVNGTTMAMNSIVAGMTEMQLSSAAADTSYRFSVSDQFGAGRPDFAYSARLLYADSLSPSTIIQGGGQITITGMGFKQGNQITVNGVAANVLSWTATEIVAVAPSLLLSGAAVNTPVDVAVVDATTGGSSVMSGALSYSSTAIDQLALVSAPTALETGMTAATPFTVRVLASDGVAEIAGASVRFTVDSGAAGLGCGAASCVVLTDAQGVAQVTLAGTAAGAVTVSATELSGGARLQIVVTDADPVRSATLNPAPVYLAEGASGSWSLVLSAVQDGKAAAGVPVNWTVGSPLVAGALSSTTGTDGTATAQVSVTTVPGGTSAGVQGCVWSSVCAGWTLHGVASADLLLQATGGAGQSVSYGSTLGSVVLTVTDGNGHPVQHATVRVYQTVDAWEGACPADGRCPSAPVLAKSSSTLTSDVNGQVTITPLEVAGQPEVVNIAAVTGTQGFVSLSLTKTP